MEADTALRILFLTLEFRAGTFSGNGVYAIAQVRALAAAGHKVFVISAQPAHASIPPDDFGVQRIIEVPVSSWHRLDAGAPWREFAGGAAGEEVCEAVRAFAPQAVLAVDWSALPAARNLAHAAGGAPLVYLNYRVFSRTATGEDLELVRGLEADAMEESTLTVALSRSDADYLVSHVARKGTAAAASVPKVLLPALREDVRRLEPPAELLRLVEALRASAGGAGHAESRGAAHVSSRALMSHEQSPDQEPGPGQERGQDSEADTQQEAEEEAEGLAECCSGPEAGAVAAMAARRYLSCVVRLSPEKEPQRFVELVEAMAAQGLLARHGLTPLLLGPANDEYAQALKARLRAVAPDSVILERFVGPSELADLYRNTRLNFHPSTYDAYGMTIVEAASQGAPSVVHDGKGAVGATDLLRAAAGEVFLLDLTVPPAEVAAAVGRLLGRRRGLAATAARALLRARSWDEAANAEGLERLVREAVEAGRRCAAGSV